MAFRLFIHAFQTIFGNLREALLISVIPFGIYYALVLLLGGPMDIGMSQVPSGSQVAVGILLLILFVAVFGFVAVSWHRFVLLEEEPRFSGSPAMSRILPYIGNSVLVALWLMLFLVPIMLVIGAVAAPLLGSDEMIGTGAPNYGLGDLLFEIIIGTLFGTLGFMYSLVLPATALNKGMTFKESRLASMKLGLVTLATVAFFVVAFNVVTNYFGVHLISGLSGILATILSLAIQWISMMLGISILTTLYGHLVEGRDLPA